ncbi:cement precursor protein 3B variant [Echinococcus granulosus]|uniref:Cement protein 3B variant n=1 Tax=Echinococcus granulosus TaxID=6210 RepID=W6UCV8_ECHGR|nr:cement precursor protein 3B variant [Echinococcus granulosus]EUB56122.1 cement precursor protein 3B variant [Echinococcus granulosus]
MDRRHEQSTMSPRWVPKLQQTTKSNIILLYSLRTRELITELPLTTATLRLNPVNTPTPTTLSFTGFEDDTASVQTDLQDRNEETPEPVRAFGGYNRPSAILFDFDPRFENSRILLANVHFVQTQRNSGYSSLQHYHRRFSLGEGFFEAQAPCLSLVRLPSWQRIAKTRDFGGLPDSLLQEQRPDRRLGSEINILQVFYSPAGHLIFAVVTTASTCRCGSSAQALLFNNFCHGSSEAVSGFGNSPDLSQQRHWSTGEGGVGEVGAFTTQLPPPPPGYTPLFLTVFHSDSLNTLRVIRFDRPLCPLHTCPTNYMPIMSRCGARLALIALATVGVGSSGVKRRYRGGRRGLVEMEGNSGTPRRRRINTLNIPESATMTAGTAQNRPSSSHLCPNWIEGDWETNAWNEEETHLTGKSASIDTGSSSPGRRKLQEMVFVYQLEPPPTLQAIARQKIRQARNYTTPTPHWITWDCRRGWWRTSDFSRPSVVPVPAGGEQPSWLTLGSPSSAETSCYGRAAFEALLSEPPMRSPRVPQNDFTNSGRHRGCSWRLQGFDVLRNCGLDWEVCLLKILAATELLCGSPISLPLFHFYVIKTNG